MAVLKGITRPRNDIAAAQFAHETKPHIDPAEPEAIEEFLKQNGPCRRIALVYLSKAWAAMTKQFLEDRELAVAGAAVFLALEESRANYFTLATYLEQAYERLRAALQQRPDFELLLAAGRRELSGEEERP
jgi:hypothetical protein